LLAAQMLNCSAVMHMGEKIRCAITVIFTCIVRNSHFDIDSKSSTTVYFRYSVEIIKINKKLTEITINFLNTPQMEAYCGVIQFISCLYVLPVVPYQMKRVGYDETGSIIATTVCCAIGSIIAAFLTDMPFIVAPPTSVSIFLAVSMQQQGLVKDAGESHCTDQNVLFYCC
jgi:hypothetical protein